MPEDKAQRQERLERRLLPFARNGRSFSVSSSKVRKANRVQYLKQYLRWGVHIIRFKGPVDEDDVSESILNCDPSLRYLQDLFRDCLVVFSYELTTDRSEEYPRLRTAAKSFVAASGAVLVEKTDDDSGTLDKNSAHWTLVIAEHRDTIQHLKPRMLSVEQLVGLTSPPADVHQLRLEQVLRPAVVAITRFVREEPVVSISMEAHLTASLRQAIIDAGSPVATNLGTSARNKIGWPPDPAERDQSSERVQNSWSFVPEGFTIANASFNRDQIPDAYALVAGGLCRVETKCGDPSAKTTNGGMTKDFKRVTRRVDPFDFALASVVTSRVETVVGYFDKLRKEPGRGGRLFLVGCCVRRKRADGSEDPDDVHLSVLVAVSSKYDALVDPSTVPWKQLSPAAPSDSKEDQDLCESACKAARIGPSHRRNKGQYTKKDLRRLAQACSKLPWQPSTDPNSTVPEYREECARALRLSTPVGDQLPRPKRHPEPGEFQFLALPMPQVRQARGLSLFAGQSAATASQPTA